MLLLARHYDRHAPSLRLADCCRSDSMGPGRAPPRRCSRLDRGQDRWSCAASGRAACRGIHSLIPLLERKRADDSGPTDSEQDGICIGDYILLLTSRLPPNRCRESSSSLTTRLMLLVSALRHARASPPLRLSSSTTHRKTKRSKLCRGVPTFGSSQIRKISALPQRSTKGSSAFGLRCSPGSQSGRDSCVEVLTSLEAAAMEPSVGAATAACSILTVSTRHGFNVRALPTAWTLVFRGPGDQSIMPIKSGQPPIPKDTGLNPVGELSSLREHF